MAAITFFSVITLNFLIFRLLPGNPAYIIGGGFSGLSEERVQQISAEFGLTKPIYEQYYLYVVNFLHGNWGFSFVSHRPVVVEITERFWNTILLLSTAIALAAIIGLFLGIKSAEKNSRARWTIVPISIVLYALPVFWTGLLALIFFSKQLRLFPLAGTTSAPPPTEPLSFVADFLYHFSLPAIVLTLHNLGMVALVARASAVDEMEQPYVLTARAKGLDRKSILYKHVLRNSLLPFITFVALSFGSIMTGSIVTEIVFSWNGLGLLVFKSVLSRDYPVLQAIFLITAILVIAANIIADFAYSFLDPRVRSGVQAYR